MAQEKPNYEVNDEFNTMAVQLVEKYSEKFDSIEIDKVCDHVLYLNLNLNLFLQ